MTSDYGVFGFAPPIVAAEAEAPASKAAEIHPCGFLPAVHPWPRRMSEGYLTDQELRLLKAHLASGATRV